MTILTKRTVWQKPRPVRKTRGSALKLGQLAPEQSANVIAALRRLRAQLGTWQRVADALPVSIKTIERVLAGRRKVTAGWSLRVAELLGETVDAVLNGAPGSTCPTCGREAE